MFAARYFAPRYYAPRYWPKVGAESVAIFGAASRSLITLAGEQSLSTIVTTAGSLSTITDTAGSTSLITLHGESSRSTINEDGAASESTII